MSVKTDTNVEAEDLVIDADEAESEVEIEDRDLSTIKEKSVSPDDGYRKAVKPFPKNELRLYNEFMKGKERLTREEELKLAEIKEEYRTKSIADPAYLEDFIHVRDIFVERNMRLVFTVARKFVNRGLPFADLVEEGNIGLINAADKYQPSSTKFCSYAYSAIKNTIQRALDEQTREIYVPVHISVLRRRIYCVRRQLAKENGGELPTDEQVAKQLNLKIEDVKHADNAEREIVSLHHVMSEEDGRSLEETLPDETIVHLLENIMGAKRSCLVQEAIECLKNERHKELIRLRYGIGTDEPLSFDELSRHFHVTRQRIKQLEADAFKHLRRFFITKKVWNY